VAVAVLDSGVARDQDLTAAGNRVLTSVNFAGASDPARLDAGGHGTHIAGTIAGDGRKSAQQYVGIAPRANIVDVRVLDAHGRGRVSSVLAGLGWVLLHKEQYNIRVVNLSLGATPLGPSYRTDPMAAAVEVAWRNGLVVVAASGNTGPNGGHVESPGVDPYVITVGSTDDQVTLRLSDDLVGWFSGWGTPTLSTPKPDLVAPGRHVVAPRVAGSYLDALLPDHIVTASNGTKYFRLTGTSMSTAVVSGAAALLLERRPNLYPDQVKGILLANTQPFGGGQSGPAAGAGLLDAYRATNASSTPTHNRGLRPADPFARVLYPILYGQPLVWRDPNYLGRDWNALTWATLEWAAPTWDNIAWDNIAWDNIAWDNIAWDNIAWDNIAWDNIAWDNIAWDNIAWD
jgi:serine protease AprX